jgi:hypothetical protein
MDERPKSEPHPLALERWLLGEASADEARRVEASLDPAARAQLRQRDAALRAYLAEAQPAEAFTARVRQRAAEQTRRDARAAPLGGASKWFAVGGMAAVTATLLFALRPGGRSPLPSGSRGEDHASETVPSAPPATTERSKGLDFDLRVYRQRGSAVERLAAGSEAAPHEVLQLGYVRAGYAHGVLLSLDGRGGVTMHFPREASESTRLPAGSGEQLLPEAYELDDAPGFERFIFVGAARPLPVDDVLSAARALAADPKRAETAPLALTLASGQRSVLVRKSAAR